MRKSLICVFLLLATQVYGQLDNRIFRDSTFYSPHKSQKLGLEFTPFFRNNEYFTGTQDGQTYFGFQVQAAGFIQINPQAELHLGFYGLQNYGDQKSISQLVPLASLIYRTHRSTFIAGTLKGAAHHQLVEPLYQMERFYTDRNENGFQWLFNTPSTQTDLWMDWEVNTNRNIPRREVFTVGLNHGHKFSLHPEHSIRPQLQMLYRHKGPSNGSSTLPIQTLINTAIGGTYEFRRGEKKVSLMSYLLDYRDFSITPSNSYVDGLGFYQTAAFSPNNRWDLMVNYWNGIEYQSAIGGAIYQSVNPFDRRFPERKRSLMFFRVHHHRMLGKNLMVDLRFDPYYDLNNGIIEPSYSLNLRYSSLFF